MIHYRSHIVHKQYYNKNKHHDLKHKKIENNNKKYKDNDFNKIALQKISSNTSFLVTRTLNNMKKDYNDFENTFTQTIFICLKNILHKYFIMNDKYWNTCDELVNLIQCNKSIYKIMEKSFKANSQYMLSKINQWNKNKYPFIKHIMITNKLSIKCRKKCLPSLDLKTITFHERFNESLKTINLPQRVIDMRFGNDFDKIINLSKLPQSVKFLKFGRSFDVLNFLTNLSSQSGLVLLNNLKEITFCKETNVSIINNEYQYKIVCYISMLPESLKINFIPMPLSFHTLYPNCFFYKKKKNKI